MPLLFVGDVVVVALEFHVSYDIVCIEEFDQYRIISTKKAGTLWMIPLLPPFAILISATAPFFVLDCTIC